MHSDVNKNLSEIKNGVEKIQFNSYNDQVGQVNLSMQYRLLKNSAILPSFQDVGYRVYSQTDEDGIINYIFSLIGTTNKICVDIAFANPFGANTTNLLVNRGWQGLLVCGSEKETDRACSFFQRNIDTLIFPPKITTSWVTAENINDTLRKNGINGEIDFLSLDIDGMDYWILKALDAISPRVIIVEYQDILGNKSLTVPYKSDFNRFDIHEDYFGASLPAFAKLAKNKGYRLVGCNKYGFNAFFMRNDIGENLFPEINTENCLTHPKVIEGQKTRYENVKNLEWIEV